MNTYNVYLSLIIRVCRCANIIPKTQFVTLLLHFFSKYPKKLLFICFRAYFEKICKKSKKKCNKLLPNWTLYYEGRR